MMNYITSAATLIASFITIFFGQVSEVEISPEQQATLIGSIAVISDFIRRQFVKSKVKRVVDPSLTDSSDQADTLIHTESLNFSKKVDTRSEHVRGQDR